MDPTQHAPDEKGNPAASRISENVIENSKFIKQLELQRSVLERLITSDLLPPRLSKNITAENQISNKPITKPNSL
jgi:hypothetical protein